MGRKLRRKEPTRLTEAKISKLKIPAGKSEDTWFDSEIRGFGVRKRGNDATYVLQYQLNGKTSKLRLGLCSEIKCDVAREMARAKRGEISKARLGLGIDPALERESKKAEAKKPKPKTLGAYITDYLEIKKAVMRATTYDNSKYYLETLWAPLHPLPLREVDRAKVAAELAAMSKQRKDGKRKLGGPITANRARACLSAFFHWAIGEGIADQNPVAGTNKREEKARERVLTDAEAAAVFLACDKTPEEEKHDYHRIVQLILLTGCRRDEIGGLQWSEIDLEKRTITLPGSRTKNHREHIVPLSNRALEILKAVPHRDKREFLFGYGKAGYSGWSKSKTGLDSVAKISAWTLHDLRRTAATRMADLGVQPHIIEAALNHVSGSKAGVAGIYNRSTYEPEKRAALEKWANYLLMAVAKANGANVTPLRKA